MVDYPIPSNDDAGKAIKLLVKTIVDAVFEGRGSAEKAEVIGPKEGVLVEVKKVPEPTKKKAKKAVKIEKEEKPKSKKTSKS